MKPRAFLFDLHDTLIDISTDEHRPELWASLSRFLAYRGLSIAGADLRHRYFETIKNDLQASAEKDGQMKPGVEDIFKPSESQ